MKRNISIVTTFIWLCSCISFGSFVCFIGQRSLSYPYWRDQTIQMYGIFEGFALQNELFGSRSCRFQGESKTGIRACRFQWLCKAYWCFLQVIPFPAHDAWGGNQSTQRFLQYHHVIQHLPRFMSVMWRVFFKQPCLRPGSSWFLAKVGDFGLLTL